MISKEQLVSATNYIRNVDIDVVTGDMGDLDSQKRLKDRISYEVGGSVKVSEGKDIELKERAQKECEALWAERKNYYLDLNNDVGGVDLGLKYYERDFSKYEEELALKLYGLDQYNKIAERRQLVEDISAHKDETTSFMVKERGKYERYGFDKESVYSAIVGNLAKSDDKKIDVPKPKLKKMSFMDKMKKRLTGKCQVEEDNKRIQRQYDEFTENLQKLFSGVDVGYIGDSAARLGDLEKFKDVGEIRDREAIDLNRRLKEYIEAKRYEAIKRSAVNNFNEQHKDEFAEIKEIRVKRERDAELVKAKRVVAEISNPQFRDVDVAKDDAGKAEVAEKRYLARKILKDRGLLSQPNKPTVKREVSKDMVRQVAQSSRQ